MGKKKKVTVGYRYFMGLHMALCRGPINSIKEVRVGDKVAWTGSITDNAQVQIDEPELFGGEEKEGGIQGPLDVMMGAPAQPVNGALAQMLGGLVPAFRGVVTLFFDGLLCAMSPYPKVWSVRVTRTTKGWEDDNCWYETRALITMTDGAGGVIHAMNPAHIVYQVLTDTAVGRGLPASRLDDESFRAAADQLYAEGFGMCLRWNRAESSVSDFVQQVLDHTGAVIYTSRASGRIVLKLLRKDYTPSALPHFDYDSGLLAIDDDDNAGQMNGLNEIIVNWRDPVAKKDRSLRVKNMGAIMAADGLTNAETVDYYGAPTFSLASRLAARDLVVRSAFIKTFKLRLDRRAAALHPGDCIRFSDAGRGITGMVLRVLELDYGTLTDGTISVTATKDVYDLPASAPVGQEGSGYVPPDPTAKDVSYWKLMEVPFRDLVMYGGSANAQALADTAGYIHAAALAPTYLSQAFFLDVQPDGAVDWARANDIGAFCPGGALTEPLNRTDTTFWLVDGQMTDMIVGGAAVIIDDEIMRVTFGYQGGVVGVARGCADTVPAAHAAGSRVWFYDGFGCTDDTEYTNGLLLNCRLLTRTTSGLLAEDDASTKSIRMAGRMIRPYPPGQVLTNGQYYPATITGQITITWAHRNRITQADLLIDTGEPSISPEPGTTYRLRIYTGSTLRRTYDNITGTSQTYTTADEAADGGPFPTLRFVLDAQRGGFTSWQAHDWTVTRA